MDFSFDSILNVFYQGIRILSKVFEIWGFKVGNGEYSYEKDFPELKEDFEGIFNAFKKD